MTEIILACASVVGIGLVYWGMCDRYNRHLLITARTPDHSLKTHLWKCEYEASEIVKIVDLYRSADSLIQKQKNDKINPDTLIDLHKAVSLARPLFEDEYDTTYYPDQEDYR